MTKSLRGHHLHGLNYISVRSQGVCSVSSVHLLTHDGAPVRLLPSSEAAAAAAPPAPAPSTSPGAVGKGHGTRGPIRIESAELQEDRGSWDTPGVAVAAVAKGRTLAGFDSAQLRDIERRGVGVEGVVAAVDQVHLHLDGGQPSSLSSMMEGKTLGG